MNLLNILVLLHAKQCSVHMFIHTYAFIHMQQVNFVISLLCYHLVNGIILCIGLRSLLTMKTTLNAKRKSMLFIR